MEIIWGEASLNDESISHLKIVEEEDDLVPYLKKLNSALLKENEIMRQKMELYEIAVKKYGIMGIK